MPADVVEEDIYAQSLQEEQYWRIKSQNLANKYPNLRNIDGRRCSLLALTGSLRLLCYVFGNGPTPHIDEIRSANHLRSYLANRYTPPDGVPPRRLFILEGVNETYKAIFGWHLRMNPLFWMRHSKSSTWESNSEGDGNVAPLASLTNSERTFHLWYCQLVRMNIDEQDSSICCAEEGRHIACSRVDGKFDGVGSIHRKTSFWAKPVGVDGWDALLVVDRPFRRILTKDNYTIIEPRSEPTPFQGGIADFIDYSDIEDASITSGPRRESIFDDLRYYFEEHGDKLRVSASPRSVTVFIEKIVASEYMLLIQYHQNLLCNLQWRLSRHDHFGQFKIDWIEQTWSDLMAFQRRLDNRRISVQEIVRLLSTPSTCTTTASTTTSPSSSSYNNTTTPSEQCRIQNWQNTGQDYTYIQSQLENLLRKTDNLVAAFTALSGATAAQQSLAEARSVRSLSVLGMLFMPLNLVAALFSMSETYQPGGNKFWVYFAVCMPLLGAVNGVAFLSIACRNFLTNLSFFLRLLFGTSTTGAGTADGTGGAGAGCAGEGGGGGGRRRSSTLASFGISSPAPALAPWSGNGHRDMNRSTTFSNDGLKGGGRGRQLEKKKEKQKDEFVVEHVEFASNILKVA